jgi:hypothetical protein
MIEKILTNKEAAQKLLDIVNNENPENDFGDLLASVTEKLVSHEKEKISNMLRIMEFNMTFNKNDSNALLCKAIRLHIDADLHHNLEYLQQLKNKIFVPTAINSDVDNRALGKN